MFTNTKVLIDPERVFVWSIIVLLSQISEKLSYFMKTPISGSYIENPHAFHP